MPRKPRVQFPGAIYHIVTRGDGRRELFHDERHYQRLTDGLAEEVVRSNWQILAYCWMPNHIHLLLKTPEPNLSRGMQHWLSGYANWYAKRNRRTGHLFQGRFKAFQVENESYFWTLSRYLHLNPCVGKKPLVDRPEQWTQSSYPGYARRANQVDWIDYELLWSGWSSEFGGTTPERSYRRFVEHGLKQGIVNPLSDALDDWVIGSKQFLKRMVRLAGGKSPAKGAQLLRRSRAFSVDEIMDFVATEYEVECSQYTGFRSSAPGREIAALLCRQLTTCTLAELSNALGLKHPDSSANLTRRAMNRLGKSTSYRKRFDAIKERLLKTENQV